MGMDVEVFTSGRSGSLTMILTWPNGMVNKSLPAAEVDHWLILTWPNGMVTKFVAKYLLSAPQNTKVGHIVSVSQTKIRTKWWCWWSNWESSLARLQARLDRFSANLHMVIFMSKTSQVFLVEDYITRSNHLPIYTTMFFRESLLCASTLTWKLNVSLLESQPCVWVFQVYGILYLTCRQLLLDPIAWSFYAKKSLVS